MLFNLDRVYLLVKYAHTAIGKERILPYDENSNEPIVYSVVGPEIQALHYESCDGGVEKNLPLVIEPGEYCIEGVKIFARKGGVRIVKIPDYSRYHIVDDGNVINFVSAIAWAVTHGNADDHLALQKLGSQVRKRKLSLTCGVVSQFARHLLNERGYAARLVLGLTLDDWNSYDNGHTLLEVKNNGKWMLVDLDNNIIFRDKDVYMDALQVFEAVQLGMLEDKIEFIAKDSWLDISGFNDKSGFNYSFYAEKILNSTASLLQWYRRVLQVLLIKKEGKWFYRDGGPTMVKRVSGYSTSYRPLSQEGFIAEFYDKE